MKKEKIKVYTYTRVSTTMQVDGYSLDAQKSGMKAYAEFNDYEIVGEYEDASKSDKSIEGCVEINRMLDDIKSGKDGVSYVCWCSNSHASVKMRQMFCLPCRSCRILALI